MKTSFAHPRRIAATIAIVILLLAAAFLLTPQGRAWAQSVFQFFSRAESDTLPLQPWQLTPIPETVTPDPGYTFNLSVAEAGHLAGFDVLEPAWLPDILSFYGASFDPEHTIVRIGYSSNRFGDMRNGLVLREELFQRIDDCDLCGVVGDSAAIETAQIDDVTGEYVVGVWKLTENGNVWESDPYLQTLRWQVNGMAFELSYMGVPEDVTKADLIVIAESMK